MGWFITNDHYYLDMGTAMGGEPVTDIGRATIYPHKRQAENALKDLGKSFRKLGYRVAATERNANTRTQKKAAEETADQDIEDAEEEDQTDRLLDPEYYISELRRFRTFIYDIRAARPEMEEKQIRAEQEVEDILHAAEFYDLDQEQAFQLYLKLHEARNRRRKYKDAILWITFINEAAPYKFLKNEPSWRIENWNRRSYRPRALPELFDEVRGARTEK